MTSDPYCGLTRLLCLSVARVLLFSIPEFDPDVEPEPVLEPSSPPSSSLERESRANGT
jgi:hypothetical protein